jgi:molybdopterin-guanine dinucleotide biosynthesis protein A
LETALSHTDTDWNLVLACDLLEIEDGLLARLLEAAAQGDPDAAVAGSAQSPEPLCAAYHRRILPLVASLIDANRLKMKDMLQLVRVVYVPLTAGLANVNTPADWIAAGGSHA